VTKRPKDIRSVTLETDSHGGYRIATDIGDILGENQQFGYRINLAHEEIHPYVEHTMGSVFWFSCFGLEDFDDSKLEFDIESQRQRQRSVPGYQLLDGKTVPTKCGMGSFTGLSKLE
jgi:iron complex outermembrane receptor protein